MSQNDLVLCPTVGGKDTRKLVLIDPDIAPDYETFVSIMESKRVAHLLEHFNINKNNFQYHFIDFHYDLFNADTILTWILPDDVGPATGFSQCGHIIHLNLKEHHLPFKHLIGQVYLDKIHSARTVLNKTAQIHHVYRNFEFEVRVVG